MPVKTTPTPSIDNTILFNSLNTPYIVFGVNDPEFTVLEENDAHASVAMVKRNDTLGKPLLEAFPDQSEEYRKSGNSELLESIRKVIKTGKPDSMPNLNYDLKSPDGKLTVKYWTVTHYPVFGKKNEIIAVYQETKDITDEVSTEKKLDVVSQQLNQVLASSLIGTWSWDIAAGRVYADANLATMFGINEKKAQAGLPLDVFIKSIHLDDQPRVMEEIDTALHGSGTYETEYRTVGDGEKQRWVLARGYVERAANAEPTAFSGVIIDITDRKRAEQALKESESRLQFLADTMPHLVWITKADGNTEYYNHQWYEYTGITPGELDDETWSGLYHPDDRARAQRAWRHSVKTGEPYEIEYRLYHAPTDTYRWVIGRASPFANEDGTVVKWYGTCTDIDEQKRTEQIQAFLSNASKELSSTLDYTATLKKITELSIPAVADWCSVDLYDEETDSIKQVSIAHADAEKISMVEEYRKYNPTPMDSPTGVPAVIRTGKTEYYPKITPEMIVAAVTDPDTLKFMTSLNMHSIIIAPLSINGKNCGGLSFVSSDSGRYYTEQDLHMVEELAARISLAMTNSTLYDESNKELKHRKELEKELRAEKQKLESRVQERTVQLEEMNTGLREEIVKRQKVENELQEYSQNLARSNRELEDFAYVASHDLQEPLRKIQAFSNLLEKEYAEQFGGDAADYLKRMHSAASRMSTLIDDLLSFSRVTTRQNPPTSVDLNAIVSDVISDLETRIKEVDGTIIVGMLPTVVADSTHMRQLFQNLIANSLKFHKPNVAPVVNVSSHVENDMIEIQVADNGIGFEEKYLDRIFSVFQRLHDKKAYDGTGIGLAVCRKIAERYNGSITAESKKGEGSTFIVRLPKTQKEN